MLVAIIIGDQAGAKRETQPVSGVSLGSQPWATAEVLGKSPIARMAEELKKGGCDSVSVVVKPSTDHETPPEDVTTDCLSSYRRGGFGAVLVVRCGAYVELDVAEMLAFHQEQRARVTRAITTSGPLDVWMVDPFGLPEKAPILTALLLMQPAMYYTNAYVNRLQSPRDVRQLVLDSFCLRCRLRPQGTEIKPGIWVCGGAQIEHSARLVAPAFIGENVQISDECLITRGSNVERNSHVDFGTAVEDSSILPNSYVGIGLDLAHSIVDGSNLLNLRYKVNLEITDSAVMRQNAVSGSHGSWWHQQNRHMAFSSAE